jgi:cell division protein ZapA
MLEDKIPVKIFGQTFEILGDASEALHYNSLAAYVEAKMKEIQDSSNIVSSQKIAVLAALNICDELFQERENKTFSVKSYDKKHAELVKLLDKALEEPGAKPVIHPPKAEAKPEPPPQGDLF